MTALWGQMNNERKSSKAGERAAEGLREATAKLSAHRGRAEVRGAVRVTRLTHSGTPCRERAAVFARRRMVHACFDLQQAFWSAKDYRGLSFVLTRR